MENIVIIIIDALRPKNLSLFGYKKETDANLKKIAKESICFLNHFSCSNATAPSLTSLFTGKYPYNHGIIHQFPYTKQEEIEKLEKNKFWFPLYLKEKGYDTIAIDWIGMWFKKGFDYYEEKEKSKSQKILNIPFIKKKLLNLPNWAYKFGKKLVKVRASSSFPPCDKTMDLVLSKIKKSKKPFFLFVHFWDTHFPFPTIKYKGSEKNDIKEVLEKIKDKQHREYFKKRVTDIGLNSIEDIIGKYDAAIQEIDKQIGRLYKFLKKGGLLENTILVILGDHGTNLTEHEIFFSSSSLYDETIHVPLIIHLPGFAGKEINGFVQNIDIVPTILEYINEKTDEKFDGKPMLNLIKKNIQIKDKVFSFDGLAHEIESVRTKNKKLIIAKDPICNLCKSSHHKNIEEYDLEKDPNEEKNIYSGKSELMKFLKEKKYKEEINYSKDWF